MPLSIQIQGGINMKTITLNNTNLSIPEIGMGCMRIVELENADAVKAGRYRIGKWNQLF